MSCVCTHIYFRVFTKKKRGNNTDDAKSYHSRCKKVAHNHTKQLCSIFRIKTQILGFNNQVRNFRTSKAQGAGNSGLPRSFRTSRNTHRKTGNSGVFSGFLGFSASLHTPACCSGCTKAAHNWCKAVHNRARLFYSERIFEHETLSVDLAFNCRNSSPINPNMYVSEIRSNK